MLAVCEINLSGVMTLESNPSTSRTFAPWTIAIVGPCERDLDGPAIHLKDNPECGRIIS